MKFNKQIAVILVLISLLFSAVGGAYYFYTQNQKTMKINNQVRAVYVASKEIKKHTKIVKSDLKQINIARKYILTTPLLKKEIIGKISKENIYKNDMFRKEKLIKSIPKDKNSTVIRKFKLNSYNIAFSMFSNPNFSIKKGDILNIISVYQGTTKKSNNSPNSVQYVATQIPVIGFLLNGKEVDKTFKKVKVTKTIKKKKVTQTIEKKATEILIDIDSKVLLELIDDYNRGHQLWMVKTGKKEPKIKKNVVKKEIIQGKKVIKRSYPIKLYKPKNRYSNMKATIHYGDEKEAAVTKNRVVKVDMQKRCNNSDKYLIGISNHISLRRGATFRYKIVRTVYRNYIIPYDKMENKYWFKTCDGLYIHKNEVKEITKKYALKRLAK